MFFFRGTSKPYNALSTAWRENYRKIGNTAGSKQWPVVSGVWKMRTVERAECGKKFKMSVMHPSRDDLTQCNFL